MFKIFHLFKYVSIFNGHYYKKCKHKLQISFQKNIEYILMMFMFFNYHSQILINIHLVKLHYILTF